MDSVQQILKNDGWYLTQEGLKKLIAEVGTEDASKIRAICLNRDLKEIGGGALPSKPESNGTLTGHIILQIQKIRNISAPKANEECNVAPRFLQIELTDGENTMQALELESIQSLNLNLPPGTKILLKSNRIRTIQGFIVLKAEDIQVLNGYVIGLSDKWEAARQTQKYTRNGIKLNSACGFPPLWVPFGKTVENHSLHIENSRDFKSMEAAQEKDKVTKDNAEFDKMRSEAIALALKQGGKKTFGGGQQNIVDHNLKKILDKGYSESEAKQALKVTNNNLERALYSLKRRDTSAYNDDANAGKGRSNWNGRNSVLDNGAPPNKPAGNVSLYDFLTNKLPMTTNTNTSSAMNTTANATPQLASAAAMTANSAPKITAKGRKFENNMSSSFAANRAESQQHIPKTTENGSKNTIKSSNNEKRLTQNPKSKIDPKKSNGNDNTNKWKNDKPSRKQYDPSQSHTNAYPSSSKRITTKQQQEQQNHHNNKKSALNNNSNNNNSNNNKRKVDFNGNKSDSVQTFMNDIIDAASKLKIKPSNQANSSKENHKTYSEPQQHRYSAQEYRQYQPKQTHRKQSNACANNTPAMRNAAQFLNQHTHPQNYSVETKTNASVSTTSNKNSVSSSQSNCLPYDLSKIVGFQNKAANEYAINLLKSQGLIMDGTAMIVQPTETPSAQASTTSVVEAPASNSNANASNAYCPVSVQPVQADTAPNYNTVYKVNSSGNWHWKKGDYCLAKYWEDGKYYEAEVTDITSRTCVVLFTAYGNFEEVLQTDCLPLDDGVHNTINTYRRNNNASSTHKYRMEREMYVPPPKRGN